MARFMAIFNSFISWLKGVTSSSTRRLGSFSSRSLFTNTFNWFRNTTIVTYFIPHRKCPYCFETIRKPNTRISGFVDIPICPHSGCGQSLPIDFFESSSKVIALIGSTDSGKTTYMTVLTEKLVSTNTLNIIGECIADIPNDAERQEHQIKVQRLYNRHEVLAGTASTSSGFASLPVVIRITNTKRKNKTIFLSFQDTAGANLSTLTNVTTQKQVTRADGIMVLLDPFNIPIILDELIEHEVVAPTTTTSNLVQEITYIYDAFKAAGRVKRNAKINIPVAFCISKADIIEKATALYMPEEVDRTFMTLADTFQDIDFSIADITDYIDQIGKERRDERLLQVMKIRFKNYAILPVSPLGKEPNSNGIITGGPEPQGVEHPLLWLLKELKFI